MEQTATVDRGDRDPRTGQFATGNQAALRHGAFSIRTPRIRGIRKLRRELEALKKQLEKSVCEITPQKGLLINQVIRTETQLRLIELFLRKHGIFRPDRLRKGNLELHPALANSYLSFLNTQKSALMSLGIDKEKAEETIDVRTYAQRKYGKKGKPE